jgi:hypothetical protein
MFVVSVDKTTVNRHVPRYSNRVSSLQVIPLETFAEVYEKPSAWPVFLPKTLKAEREHGLATAVHMQFSPVKIRAHFVRLAGLESVTLGAACFEKRSAFASVT